MATSSSGEFPIGIVFPPEGPPAYTVRRPRDEEKDEVLNAVYRLRYQWYVILMGSLPANAYPDGMERDAYDDEATVFVGFDRKGRVRGAFRVVYPLNGVLLLQDGPDGFKIPEDIYQDCLERKACELSRIIGPRMLDPEVGVIVQWEYLYAAVAMWSLQHGMTRWVFAIIKPFYDKMITEGWPLESFAYKNDYHGQAAHAVVVRMDVLSDFLALRFPWMAPLLRRRAA